MNYKGDLNLNQTSASLNVEVDIKADHLLLFSHEDKYEWQFSQIECQAPFAGAPLIIYHNDGRRLVVKSYDPELIKAVTRKASQLLYLFETNKKYIIGSTVALFTFVWLFYAFLLPALSNTIASKLKPEYKETIEKMLTTEVLKRGNFRVSTLTLEQQSEVKEFLLANTEDEFKNINILFQSTLTNTANAFALSYRTIILTDEILRTLNKNELLAVYFHELGHLKKEHVLKRTIRAASLAILANLMIGDLTGGTETLAFIGINLLGFSFDRKLESEADQISLNYINKNKISPRCFPDSLDKIKKSFSKSFKFKKISNRWTKYLQTHPLNEERRKRFDNAKDKSPCAESPWRTIKNTTLELEVVPAAIKGTR